MQTPFSPIHSQFFASSYKYFFLKYADPQICTLHGLGLQIFLLQGWEHFCSAKLNVKVFLFREENLHFLLGLP